MPLRLNIKYHGCAAARPYQQPLVFRVGNIPSRKNSGAGRTLDAGSNCKCLPANAPSRIISGPCSLNFGALTTMRGFVAALCERRIFSGASFRRSQTRRYNQTSGARFWKVRGRCGSRSLAISMKIRWRLDASQILSAVRANGVNLRLKNGLVRANRLRLRVAEWPVRANRFRLRLVEGPVRANRLHLRVAEWTVHANRLRLRVLEGLFTRTASI